MFYFHFSLPYSPPIAVALLSSNHIPSWNHLFLSRILLLSSMIPYDFVYFVLISFSISISISVTITTHPSSNGWMSNFIKIFASISSFWCYPFISFISLCYFAIDKEEYLSITAGRLFFLHFDSCFLNSCIDLLFDSVITSLSFAIHPLPLLFLSFFTFFFTNLTLIIQLS